MRPVEPQEAEPEEAAEAAPGRSPAPARTQPARPPAVAPVPPPPLAPLDRCFRQRIARGTQPIDTTLDLHGYTQNEAHNRLLHFIRNARSGGATVVLVITGKGARKSDDPFGERGVLFRQVPLWLKQPEFREHIVGFERAGVAHGGEGALYVRLRKPRRDAPTE
jgi:DNA-nicking Smr family endonuclease